MCTVFSVGIRSFKLPVPKEYAWRAGTSSKETEETEKRQRKVIMCMLTWVLFFTSTVDKTVLLYFSIKHTSDIRHNV